MINNLNSLKHELISLKIFKEDIINEISILKNHKKKIEGIAGKLPKSHQYLIQDLGSLRHQLYSLTKLIINVQSVLSSKMQ